MPGGNVPVIVFGVDCRVQALIGDIGCSPAALAATRDTAPPFISAALARRLGPDGVLRTDVGRRPLRGAATVGRLDALNGGNVAVYALPVAQRLFDRPGRLDAIYVQPATGANVAALRTTLQKAVGSWNGVLRATDPPPGAGVVTAAFVPLFGLLSLGVLGIAAVLVYNTMSLSLEDRRRDLAVIGALGCRSRTLVGGVVAEGASIGLVGGLLGTLGGVLLAHPLTASLSDFTQKFAGIPIRVHATASAVIIGALLGTALGALAAWVPARRALKMDVAAELSNRDLRADAAPGARVRRVVVYGTLAAAGVGVCWLSQRNGAIEPWQATAAPVGVVLSSAATLMTIGAAAALVARLAQRLVARGDGTTRLGVNNLVRDPGRTGVMAVAVASVVALAFLLSSTHKSIHDAIAHGVASGNQHELVVSTISPNNSLNIDAKASPALQARIAAIPGVDYLDRQVTVLTGHDQAGLIGVHGAEHPQLTLSLVAGSKNPADFAKGRVLIGATLARTRHLRPGSILQLDTPTGRKPVVVGGIGPMATSTAAWSTCPSRCSASCTATSRRRPSAWSPGRAWASISSRPGSAPPTSNPTSRWIRRARSSPAPRRERDPPARRVRRPPARPRPGVVHRRALDPAPRRQPAAPGARPPRRRRHGAAPAGTDDDDRGPRRRPRRRVARGVRWSRDGGGVHPRHPDHHRLPGSAPLRVPCHGGVGPARPGRRARRRGPPRLAHLEGAGARSPAVRMSGDWANFFVASGAAAAFAPVAARNIGEFSGATCPRDGDVDARSVGCGVEAGESYVVASSPASWWTWARWPSRSKIMMSSAGPSIGREGVRASWWRTRRPRRSRR